MLKSVEEEIEDYYELIGYEKLHWIKNLGKIIDLSGRLRFQKDGHKLQEFPETSVLGTHVNSCHFLDIFSLEVNACDKRLQNNFLQPFPWFTRSTNKRYNHPVKYCVDELSEIIAEYEIEKLKMIFCQMFQKFYMKSSLIF